MLHSDFPSRRPATNSDGSNAKLRPAYWRDKPNSLNPKSRAMKQAFIKFASNRKLCDKGSIGYMIGMVSSHDPAHIYWNFYSRDELLQRLFILIDEDKNLYRLLQSDHIAEGVSKYC